MTYQVYILYSHKWRRHYVGYSNDISRRLEQHNAGLNTSTRNGTPWILFWQSNEMHKKEALQLERKIKKRGVTRFLKDQIQH